MLTVNELFYVARKCQGVKQTEIAKLTKLSQSAVSYFEQGRATLSKKSLLLIAPLLKLNPNYINGQHPIPFKSTTLIKMLMMKPPVNRGIISSHPDMIPLDAIIIPNQILEFLAIYIGEEDRLFQHIYPSNRPYSIAAKDRIGNLYIFRNKIRTERIPFIGDYANLREKILSLRGHLFDEEEKLRFKKIFVDQDIFKKLYYWTITKEDVKRLFSSAEDELHIYPLTKIQERIILEINKTKANPSKVLKLIQRHFGSKSKLEGTS